MSVEVFISLGIYFAAMLLIGWYSYRKTSNLNDYMLGGRGLGPAVTALSAGASDMSGWMLMGLPGAMYVTGLSSAWLAVGLTIGALCELFGGRSPAAHIYRSSKRCDYNSGLFRKSV